MMWTDSSQILVFGLSASEIMRVKFWSSLDQDFSRYAKFRGEMPKLDRFNFDITVLSRVSMKSKVKYIVG